MGGSSAVRVDPLARQLDLGVHVPGLRDSGRRWLGTAKQGLAVVSLVALVALTVLDWPAEAVSEFWSSHPILTGTVTTALILGAGLLALESSRERRLAPMDQSITTGGMAGLVQPLATIDFALTAVRAVPDEVAARRAEVAGPPLRWARAWLAEGNGLPQGTPGGAVDEGLVRAVAEESIRALMSSVRGWTDLLTRTPLGLEVTALALSLRPLLMELERIPHAPGAGGVLLLDEVRLRARHLAALFDRASGSPELRPDVAAALLHEDVPAGTSLAAGLPTWILDPGAPALSTSVVPWSAVGWGEQVTQAERAYRARVGRGLGSG